MSFTSPSLRGKLLTLAIAGVLACAIVGTVAYASLERLGAAEASEAEDAVPSLLDVGRINDAVSASRESQLQLFLSLTQEQEAAFEKEMNGNPAKLTPLWADYEKRVDNEVERKLFDAVQSKFKTFKSHSDALIEQFNSGDPAHREAARTDGRDVSGREFDDVGEAIDKLSDFNVKAVATTHAGALQMHAVSTVALLSVCAVAATLLLAAAILVTNSIVRQIGGEPADVALLANKIADSDLSTPVSVRSGDTTSVVSSMARMQTALSATVDMVRGSSQSVATASAQIAQGNQDLSQRTEQQAASLEETASSMEQLSATVKQNADNAVQANQLSMTASDVATRGGGVVMQVVSTMKQINASSRKISDIIGVIDSIAFQTNILALNAAVEAARAGEQGRGFAVVATEVRVLAKRSADAAREIKSLISESVEQVGHGTVLVDQAGTTMNDIVVSIKRVTDIMGEISAASREQSAGVAQVGQAVNQMDQATQQNAALVEQSAAAAESLKTQAVELVKSVAVFKLQGASNHVVS